MAEFVEFRAEEWIPELEQMERIRLFEPKEIKSIATKRKEFEYKIQRRTKCKEDYLKYIQFEIDLHRIIKARRKKTGIKTKKAEIDFSQTHRVANLFKQVIFKFQNDVKLWMSFFKFCEGVKFYSLVSQMLVRMLQIHSSKPELWVFAAQWEFNQCKSVDNARQFLTRGLRHHPKCDSLYQELFQIEVENIKQKEREIAKKKKENEDEDYIPDEVTQNILVGKLAEVVYTSAIKAIPGVEFKVSLLNICQDKKGPSSLRNKIFEDLVENHLNDELTWDAIAKAESKGFRCDLSQLIEGESAEAMDVDQKNEANSMTVRERIQRTINVYEEGTKKLNTVKMWGYYLDFVLGLSENVKSLPVFKAKLLKTAMEAAMACGNLDETHYIAWIEKLQSCGKSKLMMKVLKKATEDHPKSVPLWYARCRLYFSLDLENAGMEIFNSAVSLVTDAAPLWSLVSKYLLSKKSPKAEEVIQEGIKLGGDVARVLKPVFIEWVAKHKGIEEARKVFESPIMNFPPDIEFHKKMISLECSQPMLSIERVRKNHELICSKFGSNDASVWLDYISFELKNGDPKMVPRIHSKALKALDSKQTDEFISEYNNLKIEGLV